MKEDQDKKHRRIGWISSIGSALVLLILFYFLIAWREPDPPIPSYGIELSFGLEEQGTGEQPVSTPQPVEQEVEEVQEVEQTEEATEPVVTEQPITEPQEEVAEPETPVTDVKSPDVVEEKTAAEPEPVKEEPVKEEPKKAEETVNNEALMDNTQQQGENNPDKGTTEQPGNEGIEEGTIDGRALMGQQGASAGASLNMSGWTWDAKPNPKDPSDEAGKIVYKVSIDGSGYIIDVELVSSTVSPVVERYYRQSVEKITFSQTTNTPAPASSSGTITFIIQAK